MADKEHTILLGNYREFGKDHQFGIHVIPLSYTIALNKDTSSKKGEPINIVVNADMVEPVHIVDEQDEGKTFQWTAERQKDGSVLLKRTLKV